MSSLELSDTFSFLPPIESISASVTSFADDAFLALTQFTSSPVSTIADVRSLPTTNELISTAYMLEDRLEILDQQKADPEKRCSVPFPSMPSATSESEPSRVRPRSMTNMEIIDTAYMLEDQLKSLEKRNADTKERCEAKSKRVKELERQLQALKDDPFLVPQHGDIQEMSRSASGRVNPVKRALGLGFDYPEVGLDEKTKNPQEISVFSDWTDEETDDATVHGHSPTVSSLVHMETISQLRSGYLRVAREGGPLSLNDDIDAGQPSYSAPTIAASFVEVAKTIRQNEDPAQGGLITNPLMPTLINRRPSSSSQLSGHSKRSFVKTLREKTLGRRASSKRVPSMESSALKAFLKSAKKGMSGAGSMKFKGTWRKQKGAKTVGKLKGHMDVPKRMTLDDIWTAGSRLNTGTATHAGTVTSTAPWSFTAQALDW